MQEEIKNLENSLKQELDKIRATMARRWYDNDPLLSQIVTHLQHSDDSTRIKLAMYLIKVIISKNVLELNYENIDNIMDAIYSGYEDPRRLRWYDVNSTVRTAMKMLEDCPSSVRYEISLEMKAVLTKMAIFLL